MQWFQFWEVVISSCAWPVTVLLIAYLLAFRFHGPISLLIERIRSISAGPVSADLSARLARAKEAARRAPSPSSLATRSPTPLRAGGRASQSPEHMDDTEQNERLEHLPSRGEVRRKTGAPEPREAETSLMPTDEIQSVLTLAALNPQLAIAWAWLQVHDALSEAVTAAHGPQMPAYADAVAKALYLYSAGALEARTVDLVHRLDVIVRHVERTDPATHLAPRLALDFARLAQQIIADVTDHQRAA